MTAMAAQTWNSSTQAWTFDNGTLTISGTGSVYWTDSNKIYEQRGEIERLVVEPGITEIGYGTFQDCTNLMQVSLPDGLTGIHGESFRGCTALEEINIPDSVTTFGRSSIWGCSSLRHMELPSSMQVLENWFFWGCKGLESVTLPEGLKTIEENVFYGCDSLKEINIPGSVNKINPGFLGWSSINSIVYDGTRDQMIAAGINPADFSNVDFLFEGDPVFTVTFDPNGGSVDVTSKQVRLYTPYGSLPVPTGGTDETFLGWYTDPTAGSLVTASTEMNLTGDKTLYAHWFSVPSALTPAKDGQQPDKLDDSPNSGKQNYNWNSASPIRSYLYESHGGLTRVACSYLNGWGYGEQRVVVEEYDRSYNLTGTFTPKLELPKWGGFFSGELYNFLVFGQENPDEDDSLELLRIVRYDKNWNRIDHVSVRGTDGMDVFSPISAGSLRFTENNGYLYIRMGRTMYQGSDGVRHQSNWTVSIDETSMQVVSSGTPGYVSHSFNQFILTSQDGSMVTLDHGDAYPRCLRVQKYTSAGALKGQLRGDGEPFDFQNFPGDTGDNYTGANVGGFVETESGYLIAYDYDGDAVDDGARDRDVYYCYIDKETFTGTPVKLTGTKDASTPILVPTGLDGGYIMWNTWEYNSCTDTLRYARYTADGSIGEIKTAKARLSDCVPVSYDGKLVWYTTYKVPGEKELTMTFYSLDEGGKLTIEKSFGQTSVTFKDVDPSAYYAEAVTWAVEKGITGGTGSGKFSPDIPCTREQIVTLLWRSAGAPKPTAKINPFNDVNPQGFAYNAILWAVEKGITGGIGNGMFGPDIPCSREQIVTLLWRNAGEPEPASTINPFNDVNSDSFAYTAILWAVEKGITGGTGNGMFSPKQTCTRAQIVTFLYRNR